MNQARTTNRRSSAPAPSTPSRQEVADSSRAVDRAPPQSIEAEKGVIGSLLLDPRLGDDVALAVKTEEFFSPTTRVIFEHMMRLHHKGRTIDLTLLSEALKSAGEFESVGGSKALLEIVETVPTAHNAVWYAKIVRDKATLRNLLYATMDIQREIFEPVAEADEVIASAEAQLFNLVEKRVGSDVKPAVDILRGAMDAIDGRGKAQAQRLRTGYEDLDALLGGLGAGELIILAGRPHMGKTAMATCIAEIVAVKHAQPTLFVSLEMTGRELGERMLSQRSGVPLAKIRDNFLTSADRVKLVEVFSEISESPLWIDEAPTRGVAEIAAVARRMKRKNGLALIVVDYLTQIEPDNPRDPREEQIAKLSRKLKAMARELAVPVICLAQLNRETAQGDTIPKLHHLRGSGAIEQDADVVLFVHRPEYYMTKETDRDSVRGQAELHVAKARQGKTGVVKLKFYNDYGRFESERFD